MSLGAKLLVGALVLGAAGTAGTYVVTNGSFGIGGNGEGSNENVQETSTQGKPATQEVSSGDATARASTETSLSPQQPPNPAPKADGQGVTNNISQKTVQHAGSVNTNAQGLNGRDTDSTCIENGSRIQPVPGGTPQVAVADKNATGKESLPQSHEEGGNDPQKAPVQVESGSDADPEKSKEGADGDSLTGSNPEVEQQGGAKDPKSPSRPNSAGEGQNQETAPLQSTDTNT